MTAELITLERFADAYEMGVCRQVSDELERHYPGWMWLVGAPNKQGVAQVRSMHMQPRYGFTIVLTSIYSASELVRQAIAAGGELLECVGMPRGRYDAARVDAAQNKDLHGFLRFKR